LAILSLGRHEAPWTLRLFLVIAISLLVGSGTHVVWDAFTHETGYFVSNDSGLKTPLLRLGGHSFRTYAVLQHVSTVFGIICIVVSYRRFLGRTLGQSTTSHSANDTMRYALLAFVAFASVACTAPLAYAYASLGGARVNISLFIVRTAIYATTAFVGLIAALAVGLSLYRRDG
jgi:hypothetical protein